MSKLHDEIRKSINRSRKSCYVLSRETGISEGQLSLFVNKKRGIGIKALERLVDALGLEIVVRPKRRRKVR